MRFLRPDPHPREPPTLCTRPTYFRHSAAFGHALWSGSGALPIPRGRTSRIAGNGPPLVWNVTRHAGG